jgi:hypothetical protein
MQTTVHVGNKIRIVVSQLHPILLLYIFFEMDFSNRQHTPGVLWCIFGGFIECFLYVVIIFVKELEGGF